MTTIHMETEKVRAVAKKLETDASLMLSSLSQARSGASRLRFAWQGGDADEFSSELNRLIKSIENQVVVVQTLSTHASREVDEWEMADGAKSFSPGGALKLHSPTKGANSFQESIGSISNRILQGTLKDRLDVTGKVIDSAKFLIFAPAAYRLLPQTVGGLGLPLAGFPGLKAFSATVFERNLMGPIGDIKGVLSGHPTKAQALGAVGIALSGAANLISNWQEYGDKGASKVAAGTAVDTAMDVALGAAGSAVGSVAFGALGTAIGGPVGAVIGAKVGGFLGGLAGSWVSSQLKQTELHDTIVNSGAEALDGIGNAVSNTVQSATNTIDRMLTRSLGSLFGR